MMDHLAAGFAHWVRWVAAHAPGVVLGCLLLAGAALYHAVNHLGIDTDTANMLDPALSYRRDHANYQQAFPQYRDTLLVVVEAATPEQADLAARRLARRLAEDPQHFVAVDFPRGEAFFARHGLLYRDADDLARLVDRLAQAQPLLARLAEETSLVGLFELLTRVADTPPPGGRPDGLLEAVERALREDAAPLSWQRLMDDVTQEGPARELLLVRPRLDQTRLLAGREAVAAVREAVDELGLTAPARVRITGKVALQLEELFSALEGARLAGLLALAFVVVVLYVGLGSLKLTLVALVTLLMGLVLSVGFASLAVGRLNLISVAFTVLYVGLGVNFIIHFLLRYQECLHHEASPRLALVATGRHMGVALSLCTITTAIGFFSFVPTAFAGIAELGLIAGVSMFITLAMSFTLLPALITLLGPVRHRSWLPRLPAGSRRWVSAPERHRVALAWGAGMTGLVALWLLPGLTFDEDPLNLRDPTSESVVTLNELRAQDPQAWNQVVVLAPSVERLEALRQRLESLAVVENTIDLRDFVPTGQTEKLALLEEARLLLGPGLLAAEFRPGSRAPGEVGAALGELRRALGDWPGEVAERLATRLDEMQVSLEADGAGAARQLEFLERRLLDTLPLSMRRLQAALQARRVERETLPESLVARWVSSDGRYRLQVVPAGTLNRPGARRDFVQAVRAVAPEATGLPVLEIEAGKAVVTAFRQALFYALVGIVLILLLILRSPGLTFKVLLPLLLGGLLTGALMSLLGIPFNFANVIALPLLLGVGVDNGIHMVYREHYVGEGSVLQTSTARAVLLAAMTTAVSFGNLAFSPHRGTASLGIVLAMGLMLTLFATLSVLPALLRSRYQ